MFLTNLWLAAKPTSAESLFSSDLTSTHCIICSQRPTYIYYRYDAQYVPADPRSARGPHIGAQICLKGRPSRTTIGTWIMDSFNQDTSCAAPSGV